MKIELKKILDNMDGEGLRHLREIQQLSQEKMAWSLCVSGKTFWRWEHDKSKMSPLAKKMLGEVYGEALINDNFYDKYLM